MQSDILVSSDVAVSGIWRALVTESDEATRTVRVYIPQLHRKNNPFKNPLVPAEGVDYESTRTALTDFPLTQLCCRGTYVPINVGDNLLVMFECGNIEYPVAVGNLSASLPEGDVIVSVYGVSQSVDNSYSAEEPASFSSAPSGSSSEAVNVGRTQLGVPYVWGAENPGRGFDCSHFIHYCYARAGYDYGYRTAANLKTLGSAVSSWNQAACGDIVVCRSGKHVVMITDPVNKTIIHASSSRGICEVKWPFEKDGQYWIRRLT